MITDGHKHESASCVTGSSVTNATGNSATTHFLPGFRFILKAEVFPLQEIELSVCSVAALRGLRLFWSCSLFGGFSLGLRVSPSARFFAVYICFVEVVSHHSTTSTHNHTEHLLYQFLLFSTTSSPSLMTTGCSVPPETGYGTTSNHKKTWWAGREKVRKGELEWKYPFI